MLIAHICDCTVEVQACRRAKERLAISPFFGQIALSCDHRHGLYDVSSRYSESNPGLPKDRCFGVF
jgi:hypothetical protein